MDALSHYNTEERVFFRLESGGAVTVIDERQFLAFWQVNKHTTDVREKKDRENHFWFDWSHYYQAFVAQKQRLIV